jgi:hypothetical protein
VVGSRVGVRAWWAWNLNIGARLTLLHAVEAGWAVSIRITVLDVVFTVLIRTINKVVVSKRGTIRSMIVYTVLLGEDRMEYVEVVGDSITSLGVRVVPLGVSAWCALMHAL